MFFSKGAISGRKVFMKRLELLLVLFVGATLTVHAQDTSSSRSVFLDVVESTGNSKTINHWRDISGNYSQTKTSSKDLEVTVRNMSPNLPGEFEVEWYFFGKPASGSGRFCYDKGSKKVTIGPSGSEKVPVESKELSAHTVRDNYWYGYSYTSGDKADGWIIRVKAGGEVVRVKASSPLLEEAAADPAAFEKLTKSGPEKTGKNRRVPNRPGEPPE
jgi:hypothetical protein